METAKEATSELSSGINRLASVVSALNRVSPFIRWVATAGMVIFVGMVLLTFSDVILRYIFNRPISGSTELTEIMMVTVVFSGIAYTQLGKAHVSLDLVTARLSSRKAIITKGITNLLSIVLFIVVIWQTAQNAALTSETTAILGISIRPFAALVPFGSFLLLIVLLRDYLQNLVDGYSLGLRRKLWLWMVGVPILVVVVFVLIVKAPHLELDITTIGLIGLVVMLILLFSDMPVGFLLIGSGLFFLIYTRGVDAGFQVIQTSWYRTVASYSWSPIMFFLLMGFVCFTAGLGRDLIDAANRWLGHFKGGLAMAAVAACTAFGAVVGDNLTGSLTVSAVALPEMRKHGYDDELSIGTLTCSGVLGTLIPPSIPFIIYAVLAEQSIGELFISGIIPGLLLAAVFMLSIYFRCWLKPVLGPPAVRAKWGDRLVSLRGSLPVLVLFVIVIGGIYGGVFTATEGGGIGAFGALVVALFMRRLTWKRFTDALVESAKFTAMAFTVLGGAMIFGYFVSVSKLAYLMAEFVAGLAVPSIVVIIIIIIIWYILGSFIPAIPMLLITVPIFLPIAKAMGWDLVWFGVIAVMMFNMAAVSPPFGINLFVMRGFTGAPTSLIFRSVWFFIAGLAIVTLLVVFYPPLATWLPYLLR